MGKSISIKAGSIELVAGLNQTETAKAIWEALPLSGKANLWGQEIYFSIPLSLQPEHERDIVQSGDLGYWPPGAALCIFFGATPASTGNEIRPASAVNVFGHIEGDVSSLKTVASGTTVTLDKSIE